MFIEQISVFLENRNGALREMTQLLGNAGVDMLALSVADTQNFGIIRMILASGATDDALKLLRDNGYIAKINHVICAKVPDRPLGLCELLDIVEKADLSVEYMYSFLRASKPGEAHMILRLSDGKKAARVFETRGVGMMSQEEVDGL
ncbi:MAG: acetolactate synthase [Clostridia bacterium]|nr:acetolactate synthase [Clostridia bacterium]